METVTKEKIVEMLKARIGLSGVICEELVNSILNEIYEITKQDQKLGLKNFGSFYINNKKARSAQNLQTKETITIPARKVMRFLPAKALKNAINKSPK